jgi:hypothetical protein
MRTNNLTYGSTLDFKNDTNLLLSLEYRYDVQQKA